MDGRMGEDGWKGEDGRMDGWNVEDVVFAGPVHWTGKKTEIELNPTAKDRTTSCSCTNSEFFWLPVVRFVEKSKNQKKTGLLSPHVLGLTHAHFSLIVGL